MDLKIKQRLVGIIVLVVFAVIVLTFISGGNSSLEEDPALSAKAPAIQPEVLPLPMPQTDQTNQQASANVPNSANVNNLGKVQATPVTAPTIPQPVATPVQGVSPAQGTAVPLPLPDAQNTRATISHPQPAMNQSNNNPPMPSATSDAQGSQITANHPASPTPAQETTQTPPAIVAQQQPEPIAAQPKVMPTKVTPKKSSQIMRNNSHGKISGVQANSAKVDKKPKITQGWTVQLGSFSSTKNAKALVNNLRAKGFSAYSVTIRAHGKTMQRVLVGPHAARDKAQKVQQRLANELSIKGIVIKNKS
jgi:cell division septation protein DedD